MTTIGSLFSGIGGLELGLEMAGLGPVVWKCESDPFCRSVLERHWPGVTRYEDVRTLTDAPAVELLCGGYPCQPFSTASRGRRVAEDLWPHMLDIARLLRPRFVVAENVQRDPIERSADDLRKEGYVAATVPVQAALVGADHERVRWWVVADSDSKSKLRGTVDVEVACLRAVSAPVAWSNPPRDLGGADGVPNRLDRLRALGNAVVPQCAEVVGWIVREIGGF